MIDRLHKRILDSVERISELYGYIPKDVLINNIDAEIKQFKREVDKPHIVDYWDCEV